MDPSRQAALELLEARWQQEAKARHYRQWLAVVEKKRAAPAPWGHQIKEQNRKVFVAYAYNLYPKDDYRGVFKELSKAFKVEFRFADERITSLHIMNKIRNMIRESAFGIYDISSWNPNVTLELGIAMGMQAKHFIIFNPGKKNLKEVPSDIRGIDRIQYRSFTELEEKVASLLSQEMPLPKHEYEIADQLTRFRLDCVRLLLEQPNLKVGEIARELKVSIEMAKIIVRPLVDDGVLEKQGATRAARYSVRPGMQILV